jgi:PAS domain S-box-containing protein
MSDIFSHNPKDRRWLVAAPFFTVVAVFLFEIQTPSLRVTPSLLTIALAFFAVLLPPRAVFWWALLLFAPMVTTLILIPNSGVYETPTFILLRSTTYVAVAWVAVGLSRYRWEAERKMAGLLALFDALKMPIVVSDVDGNINFANRASCELLNRSFEQVRDANFFTVFTQPDQRGKSIERYLKMFEMQPVENASMTISVQGQSVEMQIKATCSIFPWDNRKLLVTQLQ